MECYVANVGDSRAIMSSQWGKKLFLLSRDHRPNEEYENQRIVQNGGSLIVERFIETLFMNQFSRNKWQLYNQFNLDE
jgi:serine/threonine protein phosphatase PrpC